MENKNNNTIGARIKARRQELGFTQEAFAEVMHTTKGTICKWESDQFDMKMSVIVELSQKLSVSVEYLCTGAAAVDEEEKAIYEMIHNLENPSLKKVALEQLKALALLDV